MTVGHPLPVTAKTLWLSILLVCLGAGNALAGSTEHPGQSAHQLKREQTPQPRERSQQSFDVTLRVVPSRAVCSAHVPDVDLGTVVAGSAVDGRSRPVYLQVDCDRAVTGATLQFEGRSARPGSHIQYLVGPKGRSIPYTLEKEGRPLRQGESRQVDLEPGLRTHAHQIRLAGDVVPEEVGLYRDTVTVVLRF